MMKHSECPQILVVLLAMAMAGVGWPETATSDDRIDAVRSAHLTVTENARHQSPAAVSGSETFEYMLLPFHHSNFSSKGEFEKWLDDLGAAGWFSIFHFVAINPQNDQRLFMRPVGGVPLDVDYDIKKNRKAFSNDVRVWVRAFNRLGKRGKIPVARFTQGGKTYAVTEAYTLDGVSQTWRYRRRFAGKRHEVGPSRFKRVVEMQAEDGYVPLAIGFSDQSAQADYHVVGIKETTPERPGESEVKLKFGEANLSTPPRKWTKLINRKAKKGYQLVEVELADSSGTNFVLVFARVEINKQFTRRKCVVEPMRLNDFNRMMERLNLRGAAGYEHTIVTFGGGVNSFQFVLCKDRE